MYIFLKNKISKLKFIVSLIGKPKKVSVLMYHSISDDERFFSVRPIDFEEQLKFLADKNFNVISLKELCDMLTGKKLFIQKGVVITFDDGYKDNYSVVFPLLKKYNLKAVIFPVINLIGKEGYLNWSEILEMKKSGLVEFCCHTMNHPDLTQVSIDILEKELSESRATLEERLKSDCIAVAYPKGRLNDTVVQKTKEAGFKMAFSVRGGYIDPNDDIFRLPRLSVDSRTTWPQFLGKISGLQIIKNRI